MVERIGLVGAAGAMGQSVGQALAERGKAFRVIGRSAGALEASFGGMPRVERMTWDPEDAGSVRAALRGLDTLIYLVGVPYHQFQQHPVVMRQTLEGAIAEAIQRVVLVGTVYPYGLPRTTPVTEAHPREPHTFKGRMRKEQEDLLLEADAAGKIRGTILRLPDFYGPDIDKSFLHGAFVAALQGGTANMIGPIDTPHEFIYVPDVGPVLLDLADRPEVYGRWWHLGGPGTITQREFATRVFAAVGKAPKIRVAGKATLRLMGLFNPMMRELVEMNYLQTNPVVLDDSAIQKLLGPVKKTSYDEGIRRTLEAMRPAPAMRAA
ncbi:MAG TPA: NAD-dependent epimerase/dehydratase family protein [Myxococcaceae bacterium]|nr:NAD-dependent epimerase/dehydratase family protein [Myxococcaceae bacterium]